MIDVIDVGIKDYRDVYNLQKELVRKRQLGLIGNTLVLAEHFPVFTIGRRGSRDNLLLTEDGLRRMGIELIEVDRGGDITFHGPGQLVLYPIVDLREKKRDIHLYIRRLEEVIIDFLSRYDIRGRRRPGATGVWIDENAKIGSIGIGISKWVTYHGLSINVNNPLYYFDMIWPCGLPSVKMASIGSILKMNVNIDEAKNHLIASYEKISAMDKEEACSIRYS